MGVVVLVLVERTLGGLDDVRRRVEVGVAAAERDHVLHAGGGLQHLGANRNILLDDPPCQGLEEWSAVHQSFSCSLC